MKIMTCPLNGPRNITEFQHYGEVIDAIDPASVNDAEWTAHIWMANNTAGVVREWWCHLPTNYWFIAERNTITDEIISTYPSSALVAPGEV